MADRLQENLTTYMASQSGGTSSIARRGFFGRLTSLFGWRTNTATKNGINATGSIKMIRVDPNSPATREIDAKVGSIFQNAPLSDRVEKLLDAYLRDTTNSYADLRDRQKRINELKFMYFNDPFISRVVQLVADEATQLDVQDRLLVVESPDPRLATKIYQLFDLWGITQTRVHGACFDLELLGEAFWANKITANGVEKIIPLQPSQILERLEFNPTKVAEEIRARQGSVMTMINRDAKLQMLVQELEGTGTLSEDFAEMFETKLFGFVIDNETVVPPWTVSHFRLNADHSEFYPYGRPHLLAALAPFKQAASTMTLQALARMMSFPVTIYKVKVTPGMDPALVWDHVNTVREEYDNIGVSPTAGMTESYTVNTKIWVPEGLLEVDVKKSEADIDFVGDLEMYIDRIAVASGVPKGYLVQEWGGFGNSGVSLVEQFKPFARHVYTIQASFLEGLANLIRLHFVITGEFDYRTPFTLSLRFPAEEMDDKKREARTASMELATKVIELLSAAMGMGEDDVLPPDIVKDILAKYTFLDPTDVLKWTKQIGDQVLISKARADAEEEEANGEESGGGGSSSSSSGGGLGDLEALAGIGGGEEEAPPEEATGDLEALATTEEARLRRDVLRRLKEKRLKELRKRYKEVKDDVYFTVLRENGIREFNRNGRHVCVYAGQEIHASEQSTYKTLENWRTFKKTGESPFKMKTLHEIMGDMRDEANTPLSSTGNEKLDYSRIREGLEGIVPHEEFPIGDLITDEEETPPAE